MTNNSAPKATNVNMNIRADIRLPQCPRTLQLEGGGTIATKVLDDETLTNIAELWKEEFIKRARE